MATASRSLTPSEFTQMINNTTGHIILDDYLIDHEINVEGHVFSGSIEIRNCRFTKPVSLARCDFKGLVVLEDVEFAADLDWTSARFGADFVATNIELARGTKTKLGNVSVGGDLSWLEIHYAEPSPHDDNKATELTFNSATFAQSFELGGSLIGSLDLNSVTVGTGLSILDDSSIGGDAIFDGAKIGGSLWLSHVTFRSTTTFVSVIAGRQCYLMGAQFLGDASFNGMSVGGHLKAHRLRGEKRVRFINMAVTKSMELRRSWFGGEFELDGTSIGGDFTASGSFFGDAVQARGTTFGAIANFGAAEDRDITDPGWWGDDPKPHWTTGSYFKSGVYFADSTWKTTANFSGEVRTLTPPSSDVPGTGRGAVRCDDRLSFTGCRFEGGVQLARAAVGALEFSGCRFEGETQLEDVKTDSLDADWSTFTRLLDVSAIEGLRILRVTRSQTDSICFPETTTSLSVVDLEGTSFSTAGGDLRGVMTRIPASDAPSQRSLERAARTGGDSGLADDLAIRGKHKELERLRDQKSWVRLAWSRIYWLIARWGLRPWQLLLVLLLPLFGVLVFHQDHAVTVKSSDSGSATPVTLDYVDAALVSIDQFLPTELAQSKKYTPSSTETVGGIPADTYATILNLAGWLMVPIGVAVIVGALKRAPT